MPKSQGAEQGLIRGWHVLAGMVGFFGLIFAVNGVFLYKALATHTGVVSKQPYRKGLDYNDRIAADERQQKLGWTHSVRFERGAGLFVFTLKDRAGSPVPGLRIAGMMGRPSTNHHDASIVLTETAAGRYEARLGPRADGAWLVKLKAQVVRGNQQEVVYRLRERLWLKQQQ